MLGKVVVSQRRLVNKLGELLCHSPIGSICKTYSWMLLWKRIGLFTLSNIGCKHCSSWWIMSISMLCWFVQNSKSYRQWFHLPTEQIGTIGFFWGNFNLRVSWCFTSGSSTAWNIIDFHIESLSCQISQSQGQTSQC